MDRLIRFEPSSMVAIRIEPGHKCSGTVTFRNVMHTMPVAFRLQPVEKGRYVARPQSGIIPPLGTVMLELSYNMAPNEQLPDSLIPYPDHRFLLHSVVVPGATLASHALDNVPPDWFTAKKKQVFADSALRVMFIGAPVLAKLVTDGNMEDLRAVLERDDTPGAADSTDQKGHTLLHLAIASGRADFVQLLLEFHANLESPSRSGRTPLEAAAGAGETLIVELLLARGANPDRQSGTWGPLHQATAGGHLEVMRLLFLKGASPDAPAWDGRTALHLAVEDGRRDCARLLLANGASVDARSDSGDTPLHVAAGKGDDPMVRLLLQRGANKDIRNRSGKTAYDVAAECGHMRLFDCLRLGDSLCRAARRGDTRAVQRLLESGASVHGRDQHGWTALHRAAFKGWMEVVRVLVEKGADINATDEEGYTPLHCASESGQAEVVELLVKKGADTESRTGQGATAIQIASSLHYSGVVRLLGKGSNGKGQVAPVLRTTFDSLATDSPTSKTKNKRGAFHDRKLSLVY
ncbi:ankyrin repeat domain-containing protein 65 [Amborella trichopoda]|uniref:MSP domain-containing protein n=1 Tax=Amborella trichopoda TaxID=13333 RepID=W1NEK9_AMBTC|nr:ankyrin repeat domain-containing protein 65 [Amborella trichopoda]ERM93580.1 hypothetical protein AMTR_s00004p00114250 [Amborella trichopoda]|eukprot:XP_006826343.1 ankyrin repeat domain-containing protein 65 [Amborella trichopoda]